MKERLSIREASTRLGDGSRPEVDLTISKDVLNDLSALLLTLPRVQYERFAFLSRGIDSFLAGYDHIGKRRD